MSSSIDVERITGLVLAGGRATRMGEIDKGLLPFHGYPLVIHAVTRLSPQVGSLLINANRHRDVYEQLGHRVIGDVVEGFAGPLAGIHAGLAACETDYLVAVPCDAPFMPRDLVTRLGDALVGDATMALAYATTATGRHPVFCMMRRSVASALLAFIEGGGRSVGAWADRIDGIAVSFEHEDAFRNLNTLDDLHDAEDDA